MKNKQITFPFVYRNFLMEIGSKEPLGYDYDYRDYYTSKHKFGDESNMIFCGKKKEVINENIKK